MEYVYALRLRENDTEISWDIYNMTESNITILKENSSSLITFQHVFSSGLLTVRPTLNLTTYNTDQQCLYFVYMRGRFKDDRPLIPDEIRYNRSSCLTCQRRLSFIRILLDIDLIFKCRISIDINEC